MAATKANAQRVEVFCANNPTHPRCCFLSGTRLLTSSGDVAIDDLKIGDMVVTERGEVRAIRWIGRGAAERNSDGSWPTDAEPIRIAKDALGEGRPHTDLFITRAHLVYLNGVLAPVGDLINGSTIAAVDTDANRIMYFHVVLETHDVIVAEGAPCESLLATAEKLAGFDNASEYFALYGELPEVAMAAYAPIAGFNGGRSELKSRLRSALAPVIDIRRPLDIARDNIEARALLAKAA